MTNGTCPYTEKDGVFTITLKPKVARPPQELLYPYLSQWDTPANQFEYAGKTHCPNAGRARGDCGPASLAMIIWKLTNLRPTVNQVGIACGQPASGNGSMWTGYGQLRAGAAAYGLTLHTRSPLIKPHPVLDLDLIRSELSRGKPVIALIKYGALQEALNDYPNAIRNMDRFQGTHWVTVVEADDINVFIMDPDFWAIRRMDGSYRPVPLTAFDEALRRVPESPYCTVPYQGLILA